MIAAVQCCEPCIMRSSSTWWLACRAMDMPDPAPCSPMQPLQHPHDACHSHARGSLPCNIHDCAPKRQAQLGIKPQKLYAPFRMPPGATLPSPWRTAEDGALHILWSRRGPLRQSHCQGRCVHTPGSYYCSHATDIGVCMHVNQNHVLTAAAT